MSDKRHDAATATVGYAGVGTAAALRHRGLEQAYGGGKRPAIWHERKLLRTPKGRKAWASGAVLGTLSTIPAARGTWGLIQPKEVTSKREEKKRRSFIGEGLAGVKDSWAERTHALSQPAPTKYRAASYGAGLAAGAGSSALAGLALRKTKLAGPVKAGLTAMSGVAGATLTTPAVSREIRRRSGGHYEVTPSGVRRRKFKAHRASTKATVIEARPGKGSPHPMHLRQQLVPSDNVTKMGEGLAAKWTTGLTRAAYKVEPPKVLTQPKGIGKLVKTGRNKASMGLRNLAMDATPVASAADNVFKRGEKLAARFATELSVAADRLERKTKRGKLVATGLRQAALDPTPLAHGARVLNVRKYYGQNMSDSEKRTRVLAASNVPLVGDFTGAAQAARMAPPDQRRQAAATQFASSTTGSAVGSTAGAYGAAAMRHHKGFNQAATRASDAIDRGTDAARRAVGLKPKAGKAGLIEHFATHGPSAVRSALKPIAHNPKLAAVGALAGGAVGGNLGAVGGYQRVLQMEHNRTKNTDSRHGSRVSKLVADTGMTRREELVQLKRKRHAAALGATSATLGLGSLAALGGAALPGMPAATRGRLVRAATGASIVGGGLGGINGLQSARVARRDIKAREAALSKAFGFRMPRIAPAGVRRAKTYRASTFRQTRTSTGVLMPTRVRANLG